MHMPRPGIVEHPDDDLWDSLAAASRIAFEHFQGKVEQIIGVGLCTIRFCRVLLKADGSLAQPVMSWMDERVSKPYVHTDPEVGYVTTTSGYLAHRLTGQFSDAAGNYQGKWPINTDTWQWNEELESDDYKIPREMLFDLKLPSDVLGYVNKQAERKTSIPAGLPVIATSNDKAVEALGAGALSPKTVIVSLGTYIAGMVHSRNNRKNAVNFWTNFASMPNLYLHESNGIRRGMWTISWFKSLLGEELLSKAAEQGVCPEDYLNQIASEIPVGSEGLMTVLDWLAPEDAPFRKGMMIGFDGRHGQAHIFRSIIEGIAMTMKNHVDSMCTELDSSIENLILTGGGSNSRLMLQVFADVFGLPVNRNEVTGAASLGSAICVAVALKEYDSYHQAIMHMVRIKDRFHPSTDNHVIYNDINAQLYKHLQTYTDKFLKQSAQFFA